ncbi:MAG: universal stress protein [Deltaproteobacteria bacterium]|nr:universal stress protein [Deltaproteobacteria bacterium]
MRATLSPCCRALRCPTHRESGRRNSDEDRKNIGCGGFLRSFRGGAEARAESGGDHFQEWQQKFCPADLSVTSYVRRGDPSKQIIEAADELDIDLIVMGTRGTTGLEHVLMGSVAERTVRFAHCPVLTTKGEE